MALHERIGFESEPDISGVDSQETLGILPVFVDDAASSSAEVGVDAAMARLEVDACWPVVVPEPLSTESDSPAGQIKSSEKRVSGADKVKVRTSRPDDLDALAEVDVDSFWQVYKNYGKSRADMIAEMKEKFRNRLELIGYDWLQILECGDKEKEMIGFMMCCPTSKQPEDFISWEDTTDNGTLATTYDPNGHNVYVVSLTMAQGTLHTEAQNMLYGNLMGKFISGGFDRAFFESRLPGLRAWVGQAAAASGRKVEDISSEELDGMAEHYLHLTKKDKHGKDVAYDPLIRTFSTVGCEFVKVVPNAYQDEPSMNYGVVSVFNNPLPKWSRKAPLIASGVGSMLRAASRSYKLMKKVF